MSGAMRLLLRVRVEEQRREEFLAFLRRAIPVYEAPGRIRVQLLRSEQDAESYIEVVEYASRDAFDADQRRVEQDDTMRSVLGEWRGLLEGPPGVEVFAEDGGRWRPEPPALPRLIGTRLELREFRMSDAARVALLANDRRIAEHTLLLPHPYAESDAIAWFGMHHTQTISGRGPTYAVSLRTGNESAESPENLIGAIGLMVDAGHKRAEIGYWIGAAYWGQGFATEAAWLLIGHGFERLGLERIFAGHYGTNPASGRVMEKIGMAYEGCHRRHVFRMGVWQDVHMYAILRGDFERRRQGEGPPA